MASSRKAPYIFLTLLLIVIIFILGIKYGRRVEEKNKVITFLLSVTPTKTPIPTQPLSFSTYKHIPCGVQFLYPKTLVIKESSDEATFKEGTNELIYIVCSRSNYITTILKDDKVATEEVSFKTLKIQGKTKQEGKTNLVIFQLKNLKNGKLINVSIDKNLYTLFENTLQYLP